MIPGHEFSGVIAQVGKTVTGLKEGDRITADINMSCGHCYYCIRGDQLLCNNFTQLGIHTDGTFAEYVKAKDRWSITFRISSALRKARSLSRSPAVSMPPRL